MDNSSSEYTRRSSLEVSYYISYRHIVTCICARARAFIIGDVFFYDFMLTYVGFEYTEIFTYSNLIHLVIITGILLVTILADNYLKKSYLPILEQNWLE
jgi:hypothetical protein